MQIMTRKMKVETPSNDSATQTAEVSCKNCREKNTVQISGINSPIKFKCSNCQKMNRFPSPRQRVTRSNAVIDVRNLAEDEKRAKAFGIFIKDLRKKTPRMTMRKVKELIGISTSYISHLENGLRGIPSLSVLEKLAHTYGVNPSKLIVAAGIKIDPKFVNTHSSDPAEEFIVRCYRSLPKEERERLTDYLDFLMTRKKK